MPVPVGQPIGRETFGAVDTIGCTAPDVTSRVVVASDPFVQIEQVNFNVKPRCRRLLVAD